jgi:hypothetical protein
MSGAVSFLGTLVWWVSIFGAYFLASHRGRNRFGWTVAAVFVPFLALLVLALLPRKIRMTPEGYHPDYEGLGT